MSKSRTHRFSVAKTKINDASLEIAFICGELEYWYDNQPEHLKSSPKAIAVADAISVLKDLTRKCSEFENRAKDINWYAFRGLVPKR